jgi:hypothetical protein
MIIWDYSQRNIAVWRKLSPRHPPVHVPIGWAPTLERVASGVDKNIDVLFYGMPSNTRLQLIGDLAAAGHKTVFACGLYGAARDDLIARSKIVLNINLYDQSRVFEIVRVSYLLGNGKAVVSDVYPESDIDADIREAVAFAPLEQIIPTCARLLEDESARSRLEVLGSRAMQGRDIRAILRNALSQSGIQ